MRLRQLVNAVQERVGNPSGRERLNRAITRFLPAALPTRPEHGEALESLRREGFAFLNPLLTSQEISDLRNELQQRACYDPWAVERGEFPVTEAPAETNNARIKGVEQIAVVRRIANDPFVLRVVSGYLRCRPTIDDVVAWWSLPGRPAPKEEQFFHRDRDAVKFVKLFIYLTDVEEGEGAHVYIPGSQKSGMLLERRRRYEDSEVFANFEGSPKVMAGPRGTTFLEDTFGLHKGAVPATKPRLLLQVRYTSYPSNWAAPSGGKTATAPSPYDPYINRFIS
jgi:hypothetical protein